MFLPVLLAGFFLPLGYALAVAVLSPVLSFLFTGMPPYMILISLTVEFCIDVTAANLIYTKLPFKEKARKRDAHINYIEQRRIGFAFSQQLKYNAARIYIALIAAILAGRIISVPAHLLEIVIFNMPGVNYWAYLISLFADSFIGLILLVVIIPPLVLTLAKYLNPQTKHDEPAEEPQDESDVKEEGNI